MKQAQKLLKNLAIATAIFIVQSNSYAINIDQLQQSVKSEEEKLGARIGVALIDKETKKIWNYRGDEKFPINSTHKAYLCAAMLAEIDKSKISIDDRTIINQDELVTYSPITEKLISPKTISNRELCEAAVSYSDNTAANKVVEIIGGKKNFNSFMRSIGDHVTRLDRKEPELNEGTPGDNRDTTTPLAAANSLDKIFFSDYLSANSKTRVHEWMINDKVANDLLRKSMPFNWKIADKTGAGGHGSRSIVAVVYPSHRKPLIVAIYITQTKATISESNAAIARMGATLFKSVE